MRNWLILLLASCLTVTAQAKREGRVATVSGEYMIEVPAYMSMIQARQDALIKAQNQAIEEEFGSSNSSNVTTIVTNTNGQSGTSFQAISQGIVRGVWLGDLAEPKYEEIRQDGKTWLKVKVKGTARELVTAGIEFQAEPLRYKPDRELHTSEFKDRDNFYLYFRSPSDGYLTVFLFDITSKQVYCMLPYQSSSTGSYSITHDEDYFLFSPEKAKPGDGSVDEFVITCSEGNVEEFNELYVIFSPNPYSKIGSQQGQQRLNEELVIPSSLSYKDFNKWLVKYQQKDEDMQIKRLSLHITNK